MDKNTVIGIDLAKNIFEVAVSNRPGSVSERKRLSRRRLLPYLAQFQPATVLMEACGSAHHWGREILKLGHSPCLLPPAYVRPYVLRNKTDSSDTKALLEAHRNKDIHPVPIKTIEQQGLAALHRIRSGWLAEKVARLNAIRGILREFGIFVPLGARHVLPGLGVLLQKSDSPLPLFLKPQLAQVAQQIQHLDDSIQQLERQLQLLAKQSPTVLRLLSVPGIGLLTSTALVAFVGDIKRFKSGRHFASYLGLTPREYSSGNRRRLGRISKRGDTYIRMLIVHGARAVLLAAKRRQQNDRLRQWALEIEKRLGHNRATVALANKIARIAWAVWRNESDYEFKPLES